MAYPMMLGGQILAARFDGLNEDAGRVALQATYPLGRIRNVDQLVPGLAYLQYYGYNGHTVVDYNSDIHVVLKPPIQKTKGDMESWWVNTADLHVKDGNIVNVHIEDRSLSDAGIVPYNHGSSFGRWNRNGFIPIGMVSAELIDKLYRIEKMVFKTRPPLESLAFRFLCLEVYNESEAVRHNFLDKLSLLCDTDLYEGIIPEHQQQGFQLTLPGVGRG